MPANTRDFLALPDSAPVAPPAPPATDQLFWRPTAITQAYEPGSTGKAMTFAMALDAGVVTPEQKWTVPNSQTFNNETINEFMHLDSYDMTNTGGCIRSDDTGTEHERSV